ncbi:Phosphatidylinositol transfer protein (PITP) [Microsporum audouinii]
MASDEAPDRQKENIKPAGTTQTEESKDNKTPAEKAVDLSNLPLSAADGLIKTLFHGPLDSCKPLPPAELTSEQKSKYDSLLALVTGWTTIPATSAKNAPLEPLSDDERMFLTRECLLRYLRATKWNVTSAESRLQATLTWRREYGVKEHTPEYISIENETGKQVILGYDIHARPCLYLNPSKQNTEHSPRQIEHLVFMIERVIDLMGPGQESLALLVNFKETSSGQNATLSQGRQTLGILQNHYPERLGRALVTNMSFFILGFFKLITPFIDPLTREKLKFNEDMRQHVPPSQLLKITGGDVQFEYDHSVYWPALNALAAQKREAYRERWIQGGKLIGEHEDYLKGGSGKSLKETTAAQSLDKTDIEEKMESLAVDGPAKDQPESTTVTV